MPLFMCATCGCFDNTATSGYWTQELAYIEQHGSRKGFQPQCSEHNPELGRWHGEWPKQRPEGWLVDRRGFIWRPSEIEGVKHLGPFKPIELPAEVR